MSRTSRNSKGKPRPDGRNKEAKSNFFQQCKLGEAHAKANVSSDPEPGPEEEESVSAAILSELKIFRRENNEKLSEITSAMTSLEQSVEKMGDRLSDVERRIGQVEEGSARSTRLLGYLLRREKQLEERCEELENYTRRNNLRIYGVTEGSESGDMVQWTETFIRELLNMPPDFPLQLERAHRSLQQRPADESAPPRSLVVRFVNYQQKQQLLTKAWSMKNLQYKGKRIYMDHDYSAALQKKRREYTDIKKQLKEKNIRFQTPYPAKLRVHLKDGIKTYNSAWEAAEGLLPLGFKTSISEEEKMNRELQRMGWQTVGMSGQRRGGVMTRSLIQDMEAIQKDT